MTKGELANMLIDQAKAYVQQAGGPEKSLSRNTHMHSFHGTYDSALADAVLTDFLNTVMYNQCMDLGLYASDLHIPRTK